MSDRFTISIDKDLQKELRLIQAEFLANKLTSVSFTEVVMSLLKDSIKAYKIKKEEDRLVQILE